MPLHKSVKYMVLVTVVALVVAAGFWHPSFFVAGDSGTTAAATSSTSTTMNQPAEPIASALTADIGAQSIGDPTVSSTTATAAPKVGAAVEVIADLTTGDYYLNMHADERWPMASLSKLMTAVVASDLLSSTTQVTITSSMTAVDPTEHILNVGDTYTVSDLLRVMLLPSNNIAAEALAEYYGRAQFLAAMNAKAQAWGMTSTYYDDPSGLSAANESDGSDLLKLAQHIYVQYPEILAITRMPSATVLNVSTNQSVVVTSINQFAGQADFIGGKTGFTDQADGNLLSIFSYEGRPVFILVLGIDDGVRFNATEELYNWFKKHF